MVQCLELVLEVHILIDLNIQGWILTNNGAKVTSNETAIVASKI